MAKTKSIDPSVARATGTKKNIYTGSKSTSSLPRPMKKTLVPTSTKGPVSKTMEDLKNPPISASNKNAPIRKKIVDDVIENVPTRKKFDDDIMSDEEESTTNHRGRKKMSIVDMLGSHDDHAQMRRRMMGDFDDDYADNNSDNDNDDNSEIEEKQQKVQEAAKKIPTKPREISAKVN